MADYHTKFSLELRTENTRERIWLEKEANAIFNNPKIAAPEWEVETDGLWIYSEDAADPGPVVELLKRFAKKFKKPYLTFAWSYSCSKPNPDGFGGGAAFVTPTRVSIVETNSWLERQKKKEDANAGKEK